MGGGGQAQCMEGVNTQPVGRERGTKEAKGVKGGNGRSNMQFRGVDMQHRGMLTQHEGVHPKPRMGPHS